jgi:Bacterial pre-peptidase C-terminal domain
MTGPVGNLLLRAPGLCLVAMSVLLSPASLDGAEPPAVTRLIPMGGQRGTAVTVRFAGKVGGGDLQLVGEPDAFHFQLAENREAATLTIHPAARPGLHWLRFASAEGATELLPFAVGLIPELAETEPNNRISQAAVAGLPAVTINGVLENAKDVDTWAVTLSKGQTLVVLLQAHQPFRSPMDGVLQLVTPRGAVIAQNDDDAGRDPLLVFTAPADGTWYVRTFAFAATPNSSISFSGGADHVYRMTLSTSPLVHHTQPVVLSSDAADVPVRLAGWNLNGTPTSITAAPQIVFDGLTLPVSVHRSSSPVVLDSELGDSRLLAISQTVSGTIQDRTGRMYTLTADAAQRLQVRVDARVFGSLLDPLLSVSGPDGKEIKEADDRSDEDRDAELEFTAGTAGIYRIGLRDRFQHFGDRYFYALSVAPVQPAFRVTLAGSAWTVPADKPAEITLSIERKYGFSEVIQFEVQGLPDGLRAECADSNGDGETSKAVTMKVTGVVPGGFRGPVRIRVVPAAGSHQFAVYRTTDDTDVAELWLTAPAALEK